MLSDSLSSYRICHFSYEKQNIFFINFIAQHDEVLYHQLSAYNKEELVNNKHFEFLKQNDYTAAKPITAQHLLKTQQLVYTEHTKQNQHENWFSLSILFCLLLFTFAHYYYFRRFGQILYALFFNRVLSKLNRETNIAKEGISFILSVFFLISSSLFFYKTSIDFFQIKPDDISNFSFFLLINIALLLFYSLKFLLIRLVGYLVNTKKETNDYLNYYFLFIMIFGAILLIPVIVQTYISYETGLLLAILLFLVSEIFRIIKSVFSLISATKFSVLFIFLYLCTVEIIPVMVVYKVLINYLKTSS